MEKLFKCQYTGKLFKNENDCLRCEYENGNKKEEFYHMIDEFIRTIEYEYNVNVDRGSLRYDDMLDTTLTGTLYHYRYVNFDFILNTKKYNYYKTSDPVGDGRYDWNCNDVKSFVNNFYYSYIVPTIKSFEGKLSIYDDDYQGTIYELDDLELHRILWTMEDKRIKIEILE